MDTGKIRIRSGAVPRVVLAVDDDPAVLEIVAVMLEDLGCEVVTAAGPQEALKKLASDPRIELLFTDVEMPGMDGYELAKQAQGVRSGLKVIVTSGRAQARTDLPMVRKPFGTEALARTMEDTTGSAGSSRQDRN